MTSNVWRIFVLISIVVITSCSNQDKDGSSGNGDQQDSQHSDPTIDSPTAVDADAAAADTGSGPPRQNKLLRLKVTGSGFDPAAPAAPPGQRYYTIALSGVSRSRSDVAIDVQRFVFAQDDR